MAQEEQDVKTCLQCKHWVRTNPFKWGACYAPLPAWLTENHEIESDMIYPDATLAEKCDMYEPRKEE